MNEVTQTTPTKLSRLSQRPLIQIPNRKKTGQRQRQTPIILTANRHIAGSTALLDNDTLANGSAVELRLNDGERLIIEKSWLEATMLKAAREEGTTSFFGIINQSSDFSNGTSPANFCAWFRLQRDGDPFNKMHNMILKDQIAGGDQISAFSYNNGEIYLIADHEDTLKSEITTVVAFPPSDSTVIT